MKTISRKELETKAFDILTLSMEYNGVSDEEIWNEINNATDEQLINFLDEE